MCLNHSKLQRSIELSPAESLEAHVNDSKCNRMNFPRDTCIKRNLLANNERIELLALEYRI